MPIECVVQLHGTVLFVANPIVSRRVPVVQFAAAMAHHYDAQYPRKKRKYPQLLSLVGYEDMIRDPIPSPPHPYF